MKVICLNKDSKAGIHYNRDFKENKDYAVLAISFYLSEKELYFHVRDENGLWIKGLSNEFKITDGNLSSYWVAKWDTDNHFFIAPEAFFEKYYFDLLTDLDDRITSNFNLISELLDIEARKLPINKIAIIKEGPFKGHFLFVEENRKESQGFTLYIYKQYNSINDVTTVVEWFDEKDEISKYMEEKKISFIVL